MLPDFVAGLPDHRAFLYRPNTSTNTEAQLAHALELNLDRNLVKTRAYDYMANRDQIKMISNRAKTEDGYTRGNACRDLITQAKNVQGAGGVAISALGAAGLSMSTPAIPAFAAIAVAIGIPVGALKLGDSMAELLAPRLYNKNIEKIK